MSTPASTEPEAISVSIRRYVEIIRKRLWVVAAVVAVGLTASVLYTLRLPKIYQAVATGLYKRHNQEQAKLVGEALTV